MLFFLRKKEEFALQNKDHMFHWRENSNSNYYLQVLHVATRIALLQYPAFTQLLLRRSASTRLPTDIWGPSYQFLAPKMVMTDTQEQ